MEIDPDLQSYLHDAVVNNVVYQLDADNYREFVITVICHPDTGCPRWDGKRVVIHLHDLTLAHHFIFGAVEGRECLDSWGSQLSPWMAAKLQRLASLGGRATGHPFSVTFQSGSVLEGVCQRIFVEVDESTE